MLCKVNVYASDRSRIYGFTHTTTTQHNGRDLYALCMHNLTRVWFCYCIFVKKRLSNKKIKLMAIILAMSSAGYSYIRYSTCMYIHTIAWFVCPIHIHVCTYVLMSLTLCKSFYRAHGLLCSTIWGYRSKPVRYYSLNYIIMLNI